MSNETVSVKEAVQIRLSAQLTTDPNLRDELASSPEAVIKPIIAELIGDDGDIDLSDVTTTVHIESGNELHFVLAPDAIEFEEVSGFSVEPEMSISGMIGSFGVGLEDVDGLLGIKRRTRGGRCTNDGHRGTKCCETV